MSEIDDLKAQLAAYRAFVKGLANVLTTNPAALKSSPSVLTAIQPEINRDDSQEYTDAVKTYARDLCNRWPNML